MSALTTNYRFGDFELQPRERRLLRSGVPVSLPGKAFDVLTLLTERAPQLIRKEEFFDTVWSDAIVEESNLNYTVSLVRKALGDGQRQRFIETVPRQGYRFLAQIERVELAPLTPVAQAVPIRAVVPIVQREPELQALTAALIRTDSGMRQLVFITGEAGIGKTSVIERFLSDLPSTRVPWIARGQCVEHRGEAEAYMPVLEALGRLCRGPGVASIVATLDRFAPTWLVQMPAVVSRDQLAGLQERLIGQTRERMLREMEEALIAATANSTLILILEDLHWSDASTVDLLSRLGRDTDPARLMVIGTYRPADALSSAHSLDATVRDLQLRGGCQQISLSLLSRSSVADYLAQRFGKAIPEEVIDLLHQRTEGNPLFIAALLESWRAFGILHEANGAWTWNADLASRALEVPDSLRTFLEEQVRQLPQPHREVLEAAAVAGVRFSSAIVAAALEAPRDEIEAICGALSRGGRFIRAAGQVEYEDGTVCDTYEFVHSLYVEILYALLAAGRRVRLHQQIGVSLEEHHGDRAPEVAAELASHFRAARDARRAVRYLAVAASRSLARSAPQEAITQLDEALAMVGRLPEEAERNEQELTIQSMRASALTATRGFADAEAEAAYRRAYQLASALANPQLFPIAFGLATMLELGGRYRESEAIMDAHLPEQEAGGAFIVEARDLLACSTYHQGAFGASLEHATKGLRAFQADRHSPLTGCFGENAGVGCYTWAALSLWFLGCPDQALDHARRAVALAEGPGHTYSLANARAQLAALHQLRREPTAAEEWATRTIELAEKQGFAHRIAVGHVLRGWARGAQGLLDEGLAELQHGLEGTQRIGMELDRAYYLALLAELLAARGQYDRAQSALDDAQRQLAATRSFFYEAELWRLRGTVLVKARGAASRKTAEDCFDRAIAVATGQNAKSLLMRAVIARVGLYEGEARTAEITRTLVPLYESFTEGFNLPDLQSAARLIERRAAAN